jgi:urease accessory protein
MTTDEAAIYRLMTWLSPAYPIGAFSYSHGLEFAVEERLVADRESLFDWVAAAVESGAGRIDGAIFAAAWRAAARGEAEALQEIATLAAAWRGSAETALESEAQGAAFLATTRAAWPHPLLDRFAAERAGEAVPLAVAAGAACGSHGVSLEVALVAYLQSFAANLVSAGVRLVPLGQSDGQRAIAALEPVIARAARAAATAALDDIGSAAPMIDWCSMRHELQYTRLFRS